MNATSPQSSPVPENGDSLQPLKTSLLSSGERKALCIEPNKDHFVATRFSKYKKDRDLLKQSSKVLPTMTMKGMKVGMNGASGLVGGVLLNLFLSLDADLFASFYPSTPRNILDSSRENLSFHKGETNILVPDANREAVKNRDIFIHAAGIPVHYAKEKDAARIIAVDAIGSALVALAINEENQARSSHGKGPIRSIMISSVSSGWFGEYMLRIPPKRQAQLRRWIEMATVNFVNYAKRHFKNDHTTDESNDPIEYVQNYICENCSLLSLVNGDSINATVLPDFDYYAMSKFLMDKMLITMRDEQLIENTLVVRPVSMLGEGLDMKEDAPYLVKAIRGLLIRNSKIARGHDDPPSFPIWRRDGYYIPLENVFEVFASLIFVPRDEIENELEFITIPGVHIRQEDLYRDVIKPTVEEAWGSDPQSFEHLQVVECPRKWEVRITDTGNIHRFIKKAHSYVNKEATVDAIKRLVWKLVLQEFPQIQELKQRPVLIPVQAS